MLSNQPELQITDVYVALTKTPKEKRVAYGSLNFGVGDRKILSKSFTVFRSPRTGGLYVSWPGYPTQVEGKTVYKDYDMWLDVEESKHWTGRILDETNRLLGIQTTTTSAATTTVTTEAPPVAPAAATGTTSSGRKVGWAKK